MSDRDMSKRRMRKVSNETMMERVVAMDTASVGLHKESNEKASLAERSYGGYVRDFEFGARVRKFKT